eukprot:g82646.t1
MYRLILHYTLCFCFCGVYFSYVQARIDGLEPGSGQLVVYEDYISWYLENGTKVNDLLNTLVTRDAHGQLKYEYIHNFMTAEYSESTTRYFWAYHMRSKKDGGSGEVSSLPGPCVRSGDGGGDFSSKAFIYSESCYHSLYGVDVEAHVHCANHAWNPYDAAKRNLSSTFRRDQEQGIGFSLVEDWLESASAAGFTNARLHGAEMDVISAWAEKNKLNPRGSTSWNFRELRSFKYSQDTTTGKVFSVPGVAYGAFVSNVRDADRVVLDFRPDSEAGVLCEFCTQATKSPQPGHKGGTKCPNRRGGATGVQSGYRLEQSDDTAEMGREEKIRHFANLKTKRRGKKQAAKGHFARLLKPQCIASLRQMGLPEDGTVHELRKRLETAAGSGKGEGQVQPKKQRLRSAKQGRKTLLLHCIFAAKGAGSSRIRGPGSSALAKDGPSAKKARAECSGLTIQEWMRKERREVKMLGPATFVSFLTKRIRISQGVRSAKR